MTEIRHVDRRGKAWAFVLDCNPAQERMFRQLLSAVHHIGGREELNLKYYDNATANEMFQDTVETVVLSALNAWAEQSGNSRYPSTPDTDADEPEPYYWENF